MADIAVDNHLAAQAQAVNENRAFIVEHLDPEDVLDQLIQEALVGRYAGQRVQLMGTSRGEKNRIICDQLTTAGPDAVSKFCKILKDNRRQIFIAERLEKSLHSATTHCTSVPPTVKSSPIDVKRIKARYIRQPPTSKTDWPMHHVTKYMRLALVEKEDITIRDENLNEITKLSIQGKVDKILKKKEPLGDLKDIFHYQNKPCPRLILIMGAPGIGKTTLANKVCVKWARDGFLAEDYDVVLLIPLRSAQGKTVEEVMVEYIGNNEAYEYIKRSRGERCLIILEGLDEIAMECQKRDNFLVRVINLCTLLEQATILITSRPHACKNVKAGRTLEIIGFGNNEIKQFAEQSFTDPQTAEEFLLQFNQYPHLHSLCYIPMHLVMTVYIFHVNKKLPSTLTELYRLFIVMILQRQIKKDDSKIKLFSSPTAIPAANEEQIHKLLKDIPMEAVTTIFVLSKLAYHSFFNWNSEVSYWTKYPKIIFTRDELTHCGIEVTTDHDWDGYGLLKTTPTSDVPIDTVTYNFTHLTIQEYLCAIYVSTLSDQEQQKLLGKHFDDYPYVFIFLCGLTRLVSPETSRFVFKKLKSYNKADVLTAIQCVHESGETDSSQSATPFELNLSGATLQPYECLCIGHVLSCYAVTKVNLKFCHIGDSNAAVLGKYMYSGHVLQELILCDNELTATGVRHVMNTMIKRNATLKVLNVGNNPVGDDGISLMVDHLNHNTILSELHIRNCKLFDKGVSCVGRYLKNHDLQVLNIGENFIGDEGISVIIDGLQHNKTLTILYVYKCSLSFKGASCIGEFLRENSTLKVLNMSINHIGDNGISQLMEGLCQNTTLTTLYMQDCGFSAKGAKCISELLAVNAVLEKIEMGLNEIGDDGITAISGVLDKSKIRILSIYQCGITFTGAKELATVLSENQSIRELRIGDNPITVEGARLILQSAVNINVCEEVAIDDSCKNDSEVKKMMIYLEIRQKAKRDSNSRYTDDGEDRVDSTTQ